MDLPNYFLVELPADVRLTGAMLEEACRTLKHNREKYLAPRSTESLVAVFCDVAQSWLRPEFFLRQLALRHGPAATGFPERTLQRGLDAFFRRMTAEGFLQLLEQDLGSVQRLDKLTRGPQPNGRTESMVRGPELLLHIAAGNLPNPALMSMMLGVLVKSAQIIKCARGQSLLPRLFAHSIYQIDPKLGACLEIVEWPGGQSELETVVYEQADCVTVTGSDETLAAVRGRLAPRVRFLGYGHRVSFGYVAQESLGSFSLGKVITQAATDVIAWNQLGCLSPHLFYVEHGRGIGGEQFAERLALELAEREEDFPRGNLPTADAATIASRRDFYAVRAAQSSATRIWSSNASTAWTVVYEDDPLFQPSCLNRFVHVKGVRDLEQVLQGADRWREKVSTVGLAASPERAPQLATRLAQWGVTRICPLGQMQDPPLTWRHDGRPSLGDLVTWSEHEL